MARLLALLAGCRAHAPEPCAPASDFGEWVDALRAASPPSLVGVDATELVELKVPRSSFGSAVPLWIVGEVVAVDGQLTRGPEELERALFVAFGRERDGQLGGALVGPPAVVVVAVSRDVPWWVVRSVWEQLAEAGAEQVSFAFAGPRVITRPPTSEWGVFEEIAAAPDPYAALTELAHAGRGARHDRGAVGGIPARDARLRRRLLHDARRPEHPRADSVREARARWCVVTSSV